MKGMKKLLSILVVLTLVLSLGASAMAATVTIDDNAADANSTYTAYELLTATYNPTTKLYQYELNPTYLDAIKAGLKAAGTSSITVDGSSKDVDDLEASDGPAIVEAINNYVKNSDEMRKFANAAYDVITTKGISADKTATGKTFTDMSGYYLIAETVSNDPNAKNTSTTLVLLGTYGSEEKSVKTKEGRPTVEKKVKDMNDESGAETTWQDAADYDVNDEVPFQLKATIPADTTKSYDPYKLVFHDTLGTGLTFALPSAVNVFLNGTAVTGTFDAVAGSDCTFEVVINDITELAGFNPAVDNEITVEYKATLNTSAVIGKGGNPNEVYLEYSNDPYGTGTGKTTPDKVKVFTYELDVNKVNGAGEELTGAGFTLLKKVPTPAPEPTYVEYENLGAATLNQYYKDDDGNVYQVVREQITGGPKFQFERLDSGSYLLVETTVPAGFNKADDVNFTITANYDTNEDDPQLNSLTGTPFTDPTTSGILSGNVVNLTGVELPETGGIGTTIFYVAGAILVAGALILLVTKKRVNGTEK